MAVRFILMMALMMVASADPVPDPGINIQNVVSAVAECGGGCCGNHCDKKGCIYGNEVYPDKCCLEKTCMKFCCNDGQWEVVKHNFINKKCGRCIVDGDPHIHPFDTMVNLMDNKYKQSIIGPFAIAQPGFEADPFFGVEAHFDSCGAGLTCIHSITYKEPGIKIKLVIEDTSVRCPAGSVSGSTASGCQLKAEVTPGTPPHPHIEWHFSTPVETIYGGLRGPILLSNSNKHLTSIFSGYTNVNCITIVGTQGFSLAMCTVDGNWPFLYIWAMEELTSKKPHINGLCNEYTGRNTAFFLDRDNLGVPVSVYNTNKPRFEADFVNTWRT